MGYTVQEVSRLFNLPSRTLRYYEQEGLLPPIDRLDNGRRVYKESDLLRIRMILCMREAGMSVESIKSFNALEQQGEAALSDKRQIIEEQRAQVDAKIRDLQELLQLLDKKL